MPARVGIARLATLHAFPGFGYDCHGGSGNGPKYSGPKYSGQVRVAGSDPYDLDRDGDGRSMRVVVTSIKSSELSGRSFPAPPIASDTSIKSHRCPALCRSRAPGHPGPNWHRQAARA
jgi:hypothetical protein